MSWPRDDTKLERVRALMADQQLNRSLRAVKPFRMRTQRLDQVIETGSKSWTSSAVLIMIA